MQRQVVVWSEPPCHVDAWLLSRMVSRRQSGPADGSSGLVDELLSVEVTRRQSGPADGRSGLVDELLRLQVTQMLVGALGLVEPG